MEEIKDDIIRDKKKIMDKYFAKMLALGIANENEVFLLITDKDSTNYGEICLTNAPDKEAINYNVPDFVDIIGYIGIGFKTCYICSCKINFDAKRESVHFNESVFRHRNFSSVTLGKSTKIISHRAFAGNSSIVEIRIKGQLSVIGEDAFDYCNKLEVFEFSKLNKAILKRGCFGGCERLKEADLSSVVCLEGSSFYGCYSLKHVILPSNIESIKSYTFSDSGITELVIPDSVKLIERDTFSECEFLESVTFGNGVENLGADSFSNCGEQVKDGLTLNFKCDSIKRIGLNAFNKSKIREINASERIKTMIDIR